MAQIVSAGVNENGNFVVEFKALPQERLSSTGDTVQVAGTLGWAEPLGLNYPSPATGKMEALTIAVQVRYKNPAKATKAAKVPAKPLTMADLLAAANKGKIAPPSVPAR